MRGTILNRILQYPEVLALTIGSFVTRFWSLSFPDWVVADETHFGLFATKYLTHEYFFDIHPPFGKILIALAGWFGGVSGELNFEVSAVFGDPTFVWLRFIPALMGALLVPLVYFFVKELGFSSRVAFFSAFLVLVDNAFLLQSRLILLDIVLVFFVVLTLYLFLVARKATPFSSQWYLWYGLCGLSLGAAISVKLIGLALFLIIWIFQVFQEKVFSKNGKSLVLKAGFLIFLPLLVYVLTFILHFSLLSDTCRESCGYNAEEIAAANADSENPYSISHMMGDTLPLRFLNMQYAAFHGNFLFEGEYEFASNWYSWPFLIQPILYSEKPQGEKTSYLYLIGNPIGWWLSTLSVIAVAFVWLHKFFYREKKRFPPFLYSEEVLFLFVCYICFLLSFALVQRFTALYHYFSAAIFAMIFFGIFLDGVLSFLKKNKANLFFGSILAMLVLSFLYFAPLTYGFPLSTEEFESRIWLSTWSIKE